MKRGETQDDEDSVADMFMSYGVFGDFALATQPTMFSRLSIFRSHRQCGLLLWRLPDKQGATSPPSVAPHLGQFEHPSDRFSSIAFTAP